MTDIQAKFRALFAAQSGITDEVSTRIYNTRLPKSITTAQKAIVINMNSGEVEKYTPLVRPNFIIKAYGATMIEARAVYGAVYDALHQQNNITAGSVTWKAVDVESVGQDAIDPDTDWPYIIFFMSGYVGA
jgi:hypothetical protein